MPRLGEADDARRDRDEAIAILARCKGILCHDGHSGAVERRAAAASALIDCASAAAISAAATATVLSPPPPPPKPPLVHARHSKGAALAAELSAWGHGAAGGIDILLWSRERVTSIVEYAEYLETLVVKCDKIRLGPAGLVKIRLV